MKVPRTLDLALRPSQCLIHHIENIYPSPAISIKQKDLHLLITQGAFDRERRASYTPAAIGCPAIMKQSETPSKSIRFGVYEVDLRNSELRKQGRKIRLQEQPCRILAILLEQPGEVVTREELRKRLWSDDTFVDFDHSLNTAIMRLREALSDSSENPRFIETLPRHGYRFIAPVEELTPAAEKPGPPIFPASDLQNYIGKTPQSSAASQVPVEQRPERRKTTATRSVILTCVLVVIVLAVVKLASRQMRSDKTTSLHADQIKSLVVLPFENLSGDQDQQYFTDGMTDELIANLAKIRSLRVISRTSAMGYKGTHKTLSEIARDLNVDALVEGTVLRSGNRVRITAELVQVATDRHLWADTYESPVGDILSLQSQVASAIVNEIKINLTPEEQQRLANARPVSADSYEDYLKGRYYWNKRSEEGLTKAIEYFQLATQKDPHSAIAFAGLADCYSIIGSAIVGSVPTQEVAPKARAAALRALELDNSLAEAQTSLATVQFNYDWNWAAAATGFQRSIELNPSYATAYQRYSLYLIAMGRTRESLAEMNRARDLDPLSISMNFSLGWRLYMARQYGLAVQQLSNTLEMDPNFALARMVLGQSYEQQGAYKEAITELQKAVSISHDSPSMLGSLGHAYGVAGRKNEADETLDHLVRLSKNEYVSPFYVSIVYAGLHENDKAMDWLEKAYEDRSNAIIFLKVDPDFDGLRSDPRFQALLHRLALQ
jgi:TolB-like protein/DNA-binding winged helix-turn-helix (wHTH) protein/Flp pilus assembly protein TadD